MPICYLDRDGVINHHLPYVGTLERFFWHPEIIDILLVLKEHDYKFILVTNQSGIGRGYYSLDDFHKLNREIKKKFNLYELFIEIRFCPHKPENKCRCRKPNVGLIETDQRSEQDIFIGDQVTDMLCAYNANIKNRWLINKLDCEYSTRFAINHSYLLSKIKDWYQLDIAKSS